MSGEWDKDRVLQQGAADVIEDAADVIEDAADVIEDAADVIEDAADVIEDAPDVIEVARDRDPGGAPTGKKPSPSSRWWPSEDIGRRFRTEWQLSIVGKRVFISKSYQPSSFIAATPSLGIAISDRPTLTGESG